MENNTFEEEEMSLFGQQQQEQGRILGQRRSSMTVDGNARVVTVRVTEGRIADWKGGVQDWVVITEGNNDQSSAGLVNGV